MSEHETGLPPADAAVPNRALRVWPAALLLIVMWAMAWIPELFEDKSMPTIMVQILGPVAISALIMIWWIGLSRAPFREKLVGFFGFAVVMIVMHFLADKTAQGFIWAMFAVPLGITGFAGSLIFLARSPVYRRVGIALLVAAICFGYWTLIRFDDFRGDFQTVRKFRWQPSAEDLYLDELATRITGESDVAANEAIPLGIPEWSEFRGPQRDGVQPAVVLLEDWDNNPPKEMWRKRIGPGWSSFSVAGNRLFTQEQRGEQEAIVCFAADTGRQLWAHEYKSRFWEVIGGVGPRGTPTLSDGKLFALGAMGVLNRLDPLSGKQVWQADISKDANREPPVWGFSSSPLVVNDLVMVHAGGEGDKGLLAYDVESGELRWSAPSGDHTYSSPHLATLCGRQCVLMLSNKALEIFDPSDGKELGQHDWPYNGYRVIQPLVIDDNSVLLGTATGAGTRRIELTLDGDRFNSKETWTTTRMSPYFNDFVIHEGYLYGFDNNIFACVDLETGDRKWKKGRYGNGQVLLLPDGDQLLVISEDGELVLLRTNPDKLEELGRHVVLDGRTWNHHVLVNNRLYVRNGEEMASFEMPAAKGAEEDREEN